MEQGEREPYDIEDAWNGLESREINFSFLPTSTIPDINGADFISPESIFSWFSLLY